MADRGQEFERSSDGNPSGTAGDRDTGGFGPAEEELDIAKLDQALTAPPGTDGVPDAERRDEHLDRPPFGSGLPVVDQHPAAVDIARLIIEDPDR